jgi:CubicO group peptidase (beta-lactamase class C family)
MRVAKVPVINVLIGAALFAAVPVVFIGANGAALAGYGQSSQQDRQQDPHSRALAAGYKAAFTCSGVFDAGLTTEQITADDLEGIYVQYQQLVRSLPAAEINRERHIVSVTFDDKLPPRISAWRPGLGCTELPIGAGLEMVSILPQLKAARPAGDMDKLAWPQGDAGALSATQPPAALSQVITQLFDGHTYGAGSKTTAVIVISDGKILAERYRDGYDMHTPQRTWSVAKSITGTVVGRAVQLGLVKVDEPANIPEWKHPGDPRAAITLATLMHMNSGLWTNGPGNRTDEIYLGGGSVTQWATAMPLEAAPGTRFRYANDDALLAARSVRASLGDGQAAIDFPFTELFWRIGMFHTTPETDWQGNYILSSQVWTTARDAARLALLYINDGVWNGQRLLPEGWSKFVATPAGAQPEAGAGYGALFWVYGPKQGLPEGTYLMNGNRGQYIFIVPSKKVIIVRRGFDPDSGGRFDIARYGRDILA